MQSTSRQSVVIVVLTLIALGPYTPFFGLLHKTLPGFGTFRAPARYLVEASLLLAGHGLDAVVKQSGGAKRVASAGSRPCLCRRWD
jgi:hypothetical protein